MSGIAKLLVSKPKYTSETFEHMYAQLISYTEITHRNKDKVVELLRAIAEALVWSEQNKAGLFEYFCEQNIMGYFLTMLRMQTNRSVTVQLLQTINILAHNLASRTSIYFLMSNNYLNEIIAHAFDFTDEEILLNYISLLKGLAVNLSAETLQLFIAKGAFPLLSQSSLFYNHPDAMVRTSSRTVVINILKSKP
mmetsp:Transcript_3103/g.6434  ORF Transcript_3103/g.6434 Transcript_3103/m.6434 type:complete len:194 (-) Transcript_3103:22-603(-)